MANRFANAYALLIAVDENKEAAAALPAVGADARALRELLVHPQRCAYAPENVRLLSGSQSNRAAILDGLDWLGECLAAVPDGKATAFIYFSDHSHAERGEHYLIPYDLKLRRIGGSAIRAVDFAADVKRLAPPLRRARAPWPSAATRCGSAASTIGCVARRAAASARPGLC